jgi:hypothetical protein
MSSWTDDELARVDRADEVGIASHRADGTLRPFVTIWAVRVGDDVYLRSAHGPDNGWFRRAVAAGTGGIRIGGRTREIRFEASHDDVHDAVDAAYHDKYDRYGPAIVGSVVGPAVRSVTLRVVPTG